LARLAEGVARLSEVKLPVKVPGLHHLDLRLNDEAIKALLVAQEAAEVDPSLRNIAKGSAHRVLDVGQAVVVGLAVVFVALNAQGQLFIFRAKPAEGAGLDGSAGADARAKYLAYMGIVGFIAVNVPAVVVGPRRAREALSDFGHLVLEHQPVVFFLERGHLAEAQHVGPGVVDVADEVFEVPGGVFAAEFSIKFGVGFGHYVAQVDRNELVALSPVFARHVLEDWPENFSERSDGKRIRRGHDGAVGAHIEPRKPLGLKVDRDTREALALVVERCVAFDWGCYPRPKLYGIKSVGIESTVLEQARNRLKFNGPQKRFNRLVAVRREVKEARRVVGHQQRVVVAGAPPQVFGAHPYPHLLGVELEVALAPALVAVGILTKLVGHVNAPLANRRLVKRLVLGAHPFRAELRLEGAEFGVGSDRIKRLQTHVGHHGAVLPSVGVVGVVAHPDLGRQHHGLDRALEVAGLQRHAGQQRGVFGVQGIELALGAVAEESVLGERLRKVGKGVVVGKGHLGLDRVGVVHRANAVADGERLLAGKLGQAHSVFIKRHADRNALGRSPKRQQA